jgi:hypothetical protein
MKRVERNRDNYRDYLFLEAVFRVASVMGKVLFFVMSFAIILVLHSLASSRNLSQMY